MTLWQYYRGQALAGLLANPDWTNYTDNDLVERSALAADEMLRTEPKVSRTIVHSGDEEIDLT